MVSNNERSTHVKLDDISQKNSFLRPTPMTRKLGSDGALGPYLLAERYRRLQIKMLP
jgi:hypothetical protein